jgi:predicted DNA-binding transcriptional regulator YafY
MERGTSSPAAGKVPKIALLLRLLAAIDEGRFGFEELKGQVDEERPPSTRTLRRDLAEVAAAGFPWSFDRSAGVYRFEQGYSLRKMRLTPDELFGLLALKGIATSLGGNIGASMGGMTERLATVADRASVGAAATPAVLVQIADPNLDSEHGETFVTLQRAQLDRQSVRFTYIDKRGSSSKRHVDLYGFVVSGGRVYAVAHDRGRGAKRVFALDGIADVKVAPQRFTMPADFDIAAFAARSVSGIMHGDESTLVTVAYSPVVARAAIADRVVRERAIEKRLDGSVVIAYTVSDAGEFVRWALKWGAEAEILAPANVRSLAATMAAEILARYTSGNS